MDDVTLREFEPADRDWVVERHVAHYSGAFGWDGTFETRVAEITDAFVDRQFPERERGWVAEANGARLGCIFCIDGGKPGSAQLRMFLVEPEARGKGLGKRLIETCMSFARDAGYERMWLLTHESHTTAVALYARYGFEITKSENVHCFGVDLVEQIWEIGL